MNAAPGTAIIDISAPVGEASPCFPGDTPYSQRWAATLSAQCPVNVSAITMSPHVGTHADAPLHYAPDGEPVGALDLSPFIGPCRVIHARGLDWSTARPGWGPLVEWSHIAHAVQGLPARVLVRTYDHMPADRWDPCFASFAAPTIEQLAALGVVLVGIDSASIDPADSKPLPSHQAIRRLGLRVLENLVLDHVAEGDYELIALPLKLASADASPVRAVLRAV